MRDYPKGLSVSQQYSFVDKLYISDDLHTFVYIITANFDRYILVISANFNFPQPEVMVEGLKLPTRKQITTHYLHALCKLIKFIKAFSNTTVSLPDREALHSVNPPYVCVKSISLRLLSVRNMVHTET